MGDEHMKNRKRKTRYFLENKGVAWKFLIIMAVISVIIALVYRYFSDGSEQKAIEDNGQNGIEKTEEVVEPTFNEGRIDFEDFLVQETSRKHHELYLQQEPIRGVYLTANTAGGKRLDDLIGLANRTEVNAFVVDIKTDDGRLAFDMDIPVADEVGAEYITIKDVDGFMNKLYDNNIYPIARVVVFKDRFMSSKMPDYAIKNKDGSLFKYDKVTWLNPYNEDVYKYIVDICKEIIDAGFKEIQFDYIRFAATYRLNDAYFGEIDPEKEKIDAILDFLDYVNEALKDEDIKISADVFGSIITSNHDAETIGQNYLEMARRLDVICPMVYPSHYGRGYYGIPSSESPDFYPYQIINGSMEDSNKVLSALPENERPIVRPWLQAFTASYLKHPNYMEYGAKAYRDQMQGAYDAQLSEWLLWNAGNRYREEGLLPEGQFYEEEIVEQ